MPSGNKSAAHFAKMHAARSEKFSKSTASKILTWLFSASLSKVFRIREDVPGIVSSRWRQLIDLKYIRALAGYRNGILVTDLSHKGTSVDHLEVLTKMVRESYGHRASRAKGNPKPVSLTVTRIYEYLTTTPLTKWVKSGESPGAIRTHRPMLLKAGYLVWDDKRNQTFVSAQALTGSREKHIAVISNLVNNRLPMTHHVVGRGRPPKGVSMSAWPKEANEVRFSQYAKKSALKLWRFICKTAVNKPLKVKDMPGIVHRYTPLLVSLGYFRRASMKAPCFVTRLCEEGDDSQHLTALISAVRNTYKDIGTPDSPVVISVAPIAFTSTSVGHKETVVNSKPNRLPVVKSSAIEQAFTSAVTVLKAQEKAINDLIVRVTSLEAQVMELQAPTPASNEEMSTTAMLETLTKKLNEMVPVPSGH